LPKPRRRLHVRLPAYITPRNEWRGLIQAVVHKAQQERNVTYGPTERLELVVRLYLPEAALTTHDVDNRLKDVMDALQGRVGGPKAITPRSPVIKNDHQIWRVTIEKASPPKQSGGLGHLTIGRYRPARARR